MKRVFLKAEEIHCSAEPTVVSTVLGSCISLCIWDQRLHVGGINHFVLPEGSSEEQRLHPNRYASQSIPSLLRQLKNLGSRPRDLVIKMVGGASVADGPGLALGVGKANIEAAQRILAAYGLSVAAQRVGGHRGRKLEFFTATGELRLHGIATNPAPDLTQLSSRLCQNTLIAIGASTGGTEALKQILCGLPSLMPPILIVQHIPAAFCTPFARQLDSLCSLTVKEAKHGEILRPGVVYIAPGGRQMKLREAANVLRLTITDDPPENNFKPSVDYLFRSLVTLGEQRLIAVLLTGMGADGARGLKQLRDAGAVTLVQDESSSIVFGMPRAAIELGAASQVLPLNSIAAALVKNSLASSPLLKKQSR